MAATSNPINHGTIQLSTKPNANLSYSFLPGDAKTETLVVFLNGLILPKVSWERTMLAIQSRFQDGEISQPHLLAYDRYGQGTSDKDPSGDHDVLDSAHDLHTFLVEFCDKKLKTNLAEQQVVFVCNSIGCAVARLFAKTYPTTVSGFVFLDSIMAHVDLVALWPDVDAPGFQKEELPKGTSVEDMRRVKEEYRKRFAVSAPNPEGLDRKTLAGLLPEASGPKLQGNPWLTVVGHDDETFAQENEKTFGVSPGLVHKYINSVWHNYNKELATLTSSNKSKGPVVAKGCGHFIQRDDSEFVAAEARNLTSSMATEEACDKLWAPPRIDRESSAYAYTGRRLEWRTRVSEPTVASADSPSTSKSGTVAKSSTTVAQSRPTTTPAPDLPPDLPPAYEDSFSLDPWTSRSKHTHKRRLRYEGRKVRWDYGISEDSYARNIPDTFFVCKRKTKTDGGIMNDLCLNIVRTLDSHRRELDRNRHCDFEYIKTGKTCRDTSRLCVWVPGKTGMWVWKAMQRHDEKCSCGAFDFSNSRAR
ncbi:alpha/beta-hydrolase, partial [Aureobasidium melanogenum]